MTRRTATHSTSRRSKSGNGVVIAPAVVKPEFVKDPALEFRFEPSRFSNWDMPLPLNSNAKELSPTEVQELLLGYQAISPRFYAGFCRADTFMGIGLFARNELTFIGGLREEYLLPHAGFAIPETILIGKWNILNPKQYHVRLVLPDQKERRIERIALASLNQGLGRGDYHRDISWVYDPSLSIGRDNGGTLYSAANGRIHDHELDEAPEVRDRFREVLLGYERVARARAPKGILHKD